MENDVGKISSFLSWKDSSMKWKGILIDFTRNDFWRCFSLSLSRLQTIEEGRKNFFFWNTRQIHKSFAINFNAIDCACMIYKSFHPTIILLLLFAYFSVFSKKNCLHLPKFFMILNASTFSTHSSQRFHQFVPFWCVFFLANRKIT